MTMSIFQQQQRQFLAYLRSPTPDNYPVGFNRERLMVYSELLYNKFDESLSACFPVLHSILTPIRWQQLLKDFIAEHRCATPYYRRIPDEFVRYLQNHRRHADDPPFLAELAHFEWMELVLSVSESEPVSIKPATDAELLAGIPVFVPILQFLHYSWPVQHISAAFQLTQPPAETTHILGFRNVSDDVRFMELNPATLRLLLLLHGGFTCQAALTIMGEMLNWADTSQLLHFGQDLLGDLQHQGAIIGCHPVTLS